MNTLYKEKSVTMSNPLYQKISKIRDLINTSRKQNILLQDNILWHMLCSCMDTIEDTEEALESFLNQTPTVLMKVEIIYVSTVLYRLFLCSKMP